MKVKNLDNIIQDIPENKISNDVMCFSDPFVVSIQVENKKLKEELAQVKAESENHNRSFLNMFEQNEEKTETINILNTKIDWQRDTIKDLKEDIDKIHEMYSTIRNKQSKSVAPQLIEYTLKINKLETLLKQAISPVKIKRNRDYENGYRDTDKEDSWIKEVEELVGKNE